MVDVIEVTEHDVAMIVTMMTMTTTGDKIVEMEIEMGIGSATGIGIVEEGGETIGIGTMIEVKITRVEEVVEESSHST